MAKDSLTYYLVWVPVALIAVFLCYKFVQRFTKKQKDIIWWVSVAIGLIVIYKLDYLAGLLGERNLLFFMLVFFVPFTLISKFALWGTPSYKDLSADGKSFKFSKDDKSFRIK